MITGSTKLFFSLTYFALVFAMKPDHQVQEASGQEASGLLHQSIELSNYIILPFPIEEVDWYLKSKSSSKIARFENNQTKIYPPELTTRLELLKNGTTLRIRDLRLKDRGQYIASIILTDKKTREANFLLTVYDPVPSPSLTIEYKNETNDQCNMTLHCSVPANISGLSYSWKYRRRDSDYQLFNSTGDTIQISLQPEAWHFLCTVNNPADHKDAFIQAKCNASGVAAYRRHFCILCVIPILLILSGIILKLKRKDKTLEHHMFGRKNKELLQTAAEDQGIRQDVELLEYCTPTFNRNDSATISCQNFSWKERNEIPAPQKFETLYARLEMKKEETNYFPPLTSVP